MKKGIITFLLIVTCVMFISPINTKALETNNINIVDRSGSNFIENTINTAEVTKSVLGDPSDENSVAWLVQLIFNIIKIAGPILVVLLSSIDFIMVILKSDSEQFAKAQKRLITRLILALLLFLIPTIVQIILQVFGITGNVTAGIK